MDHVPHDLYERRTEGKSELDDEMKVLNVVKYYHPSTGGMETYVRQLSRGLGAHGIQATVLTINHVAGTKTTRENIDHVPVHRVGCQLKLLSQPVSWSFSEEMERLVAETDIVHLHSPFPNAEILSGTLAGKPLIVTWCADPANTRWKGVSLLFRPRLLRVLHQARRIVLIGPSLLENSPTLQPFQGKCEVIPLAYTHRASGGAPARSNTGKGMTVLFVGKLRKYKGVEYLLRALVDLPEIKLRIVGEGEERIPLEKLSQSLGLGPRVMFFGNLPDESLVGEYSTADLFVLPSIDASEAFGIVQAEAMSYGLPVINTNLASSVPFVSLHELTGLTVAARDVSGLAAAIRRLSQDRGFYENCSRNALARAKLFSEQNLLEGYAKVYRNYGQAGGAG